MSTTSILLSLLLGCDGGDDSVPPPIDADGDGLTEAEDCDDNNAQAADLKEVCDNIDNDCDGAVDDGLMQTWYADYDRDGYGDPESSFARCMKQEGFVTNDDDCDDDDEDVGPCED